MSCLYSCSVVVSCAALAALSAETPQDRHLPAVTVRGTTFELVRIPSGEFQMGSDNAGESPRHRVQVRGFDIGRTEVTVRQFRAFTTATGYRTDAEKEGWAWTCCSTRPPESGWRSRGYWERREGASWRNPGFSQSDDDPVVAISWHDAAEFCKWLSAETGQNYRLPSEAEWEYAARAGAETDTVTDAGEAGWYRDNSGLRTHPVAQKQANAWGLYDTLGNAWEWVADVWAVDYSGAPTDGSARSEGGSASAHIEAGDGRPLRGGAWGLERETLRYTDRPAFGSHQRCNNSGFRIARSVEPSSK
jgi:formylglycine-generating enzyme required for sulfatase activity